MDIVRCVSCDGYGWETDDDGAAQDCDWCGGTGYVYRDERGIDHHIPPEDYGKVADILEKLDINRLRDIGYTGEPKRMEDQEIRKRNQSPDSEDEA